MPRYIDNQALKQNDSVARGGSHTRLSLFSGSPFDDNALVAQAEDHPIPNSALKFATLIASNCLMRLAQCVHREQCPSVPPLSHKAPFQAYKGQLVCCRYYCIDTSHPTILPNN